VRAGRLQFLQGCDMLKSWMGCGGGGARDGCAGLGLDWGDLRVLRKTICGRDGMRDGRKRSII